MREPVQYEKSRKVSREFMNENMSKEGTPVFHRPMSLAKIFVDTRSGSVANIIRLSSFEKSSITASYS